MRLIDADALFETLVTGDIRETQQFCYPCKKVLEAIDAQPTVDPQQAIRDAYKHGKSKGIKKGIAISKGTYHNKVNLCDSCEHLYPECPGMNILFGDGTGLDNICACSAYQPLRERP